MLELPWWSRSYWVLHSIVLDNIFRNKSSILRTPYLSIHWFKFEISKNLLSLASYCNLMPEDCYLQIEIFNFFEHDACNMIVVIDAKWCPKKPYPLCIWVIMICAACRIIKSVTIWIILNWILRLNEKIKNYLCLKLFAWTLA